MQAGALQQLEDQVQAIVSPLGYEVVALESSAGVAGSGPRLVLYIDFASSAESPESKESKPRYIGIEDCVAVNRAVDELFESTPLLSGGYTLEVSSPGVERILKRPRDFERFKGNKAKIQTTRSLSAEELENPLHWEKNQRQKNFIGELLGFDSTKSGKIKMEIDGQGIYIPAEVVSKAHLVLGEIGK